MKRYEYRRLSGFECYIWSDVQQYGAEGFRLVAPHGPMHGTYFGLMEREVVDEAETDRAGKGAVRTAAEVSDGR